MYKTLAALGLATVTRAGSVGTDSSTLNIGHKQTEKMPEKKWLHSLWVLIIDLLLWMSYKATKLQRISSTLDLSKKEGNTPEAT